MVAAAAAAAAAATELLLSWDETTDNSLESTEISFRGSMLLIIESAIFALLDKNFTPQLWIWFASWILRIPLGELVKLQRIE